LLQGITGARARLQLGREEKTSERPRGGIEDDPDCCLIFMFEFVTSRCVSLPCSACVESSSFKFNPTTIV
jgi:hypothetical protein